jgi:acyl-CoA synthetase (AMP-forming)/AMP-acid ligase II
MDKGGENISPRVIETATSDDILEYCKGKLKKFFVPKEVIILQAVPKTLVGKILKKELRKMG